MFENIIKSIVCDTILPSNIAEKLGFQCENSHLE
jgi:hypothetical protein